MLIVGAPQHAASPAGFPSSFVSMARAQWLLAPLLDATRPMDAMALSLDLPAEDEIATAGLSGVQLCCCFTCVSRVASHIDSAWAGACIAGRNTARPMGDAGCRLGSNSKAEA